MCCKFTDKFVFLVYDDDTSWTVGTVWEPEQLANSDEYHTRLFQILWEGRGTYERFQEILIQKELLSSSDQIQQQVCNPNGDNYNNIC